MITLCFIGLSGITGAPVGAGEARTKIVAHSEVAAESDGCLDHAVKELGMSAKRQEARRAWTIGPQFLHSSVVTGGALELLIDRQPTGSKIVVTTSFPATSRSEVDEKEIESRVGAIASKMAQLCGVTRPVVRCEVTPASGPARACRLD
ncbi:MAG: hypothetical protein HY791_06565 [Deltaproteobacteria bacterium]|nr:hypothetical protein [Deltaproteobacteria bacterium]